MGVRERRRQAMVVVLFQALPGSSVHLPSCFIAHELDIPLLATKLAEIHKLRNYCYDKDYLLLLAKHYQSPERSLIVVSVQETLIRV